jgi:short-subunit dehydrogenase
MNKLTVISGGTKGIGRSLVEKFASQGFDIITCARTESDLKNLQEKIKKQYTGIKILVFKADLARNDDRIAFISFILSQRGPVDVLINNAGIFIPGQIHNEKAGILEKMIESNLYSAYYLTKGLIGPMITHRQGYIFNICSTASITAYSNGGSYGISKFAMLGMSKVLREEMKPFNIRVSAVLPGATYTESWEGTDIPPDRFMKPEDVAETVWNAYSLSPGSVVEEILIRPMLGDL